MNYQNPEKNRGKNDPVQPLIDFIDHFYPLSDEIKEFISTHTYFKTFSKGKYLLKAGDVCNDYYFIAKGVLRSFLKFGSKEITVWINPENEITTAIRSMSNHKVADEYIQVIENAELVVIPYEVMQNFYTTFPEMNLVGRMLLEQYYAASEERVYICRIPSAEARYKHFVESRPELANRISLKYVASYLGMTLETLSRLRSKRAGK
jgi:CRP-like cAMP-binding protein